MTSQTHRLIFNPTRGCVMAVAETSLSGGKSGASGTTRSSRTRHKRCMSFPEFHGSNWPLAPVGIAQAAITSIAIKGSTTQTLNQTTLKGNVNFDAALKITVQIPDTVLATPAGQDLKSQINALVGAIGPAAGSEAISTPGLDYLNQLAANPNIQWDKVALAHEKWDYDHAGLTGAGAALLTVVVAYFTAGAGTALVGTAAAGTTTATGALAYTATGIAINAGFTALASQAAVAMVNNQGDIGKTLDQLGKEESIKGLLLTMVTAGALDKLNSSMGWQGITAKSPFIDQFQKNLTNNLASDMMNSALAGKPFDEQTFANSLKGALTTTGMAQGANEIGNAYTGQQSVLPNLNDFTHKLAHAVLGCAGGAATAGNASGCAPGAVGAVVGELTAEYAKNNHMSDADALNLAKVVAAASGVIVGGGGDNAQAVNIAVTTGANAAENNRLKHISRPLDVLKGYLPAEHRATVVERNSPDQFPDDIHKTLGEPARLPDGKYGYVVEDLKSSDNKLYPVANGAPDLTGTASSATATRNALSNGNVTIYRTDPDNFPSENQLLRNYANDIKSGATVPYPSLGETVGCYANFCDNFTNSNTMADKRLQQTGILPPNTGTANVPGGIHDSDVTPWDALLNSLTDKLNKRMEKGEK